MSTRNSPPKQRKRKAVITSHDGQRSVGHNLHTRKPTIEDPTNGSTFSGQVGAGGAPGACPSVFETDDDK
jgi:hypothetical protein